MHSYQQALQHWRDALHSEEPTVTLAGMCFRWVEETYRASLGSNLYPNLDHVNWLDDAGGSHATETTIEERLCCLPGWAQVFPLKVRHLQVRDVSAP
jgi:hypothetical protein